MKLITATTLLLAFAVLAPAARAQTEPPPCVEETVVMQVQADTWIDLNSTLANKGSDPVLSVGGDARALVRFGLPAEVPAGCVLESAKLRMFADSGTEGARVEAVRAASAWLEGSVSWDSQPGLTGAASAAWSTDGYMAWNVTAHVREMLEGVGANNGWLLRDAAEGTETVGGHGFYAREKGESPPELVLRFAAPPSGEPRPIEPPTPVSVACGELVTRSILVTNDLVDCAGDGLVIGASRIVVDLDEHTIDGVGLGTGVRNEGYGSVTVRNGTVADFDLGVELLPETAGNVIEGLRLHQNEVAAVKLFDADGGNAIRDSVIEDNGGGIQLVSGTTGATVSGNTLTRNSGAALLVRDSGDNRLEGNNVVGGGDLGVGLERATGNVLVGNVVSGTSDGGIELLLGSHDNRVEGNVVRDAGDTGIMVSESDRNVVASNATQGMSDSGITLNTANDGEVRDNDLGANPGGLQMDGSSRNLVLGNVAIGGSGIGIEVGGGSFGNTIVLNRTGGNGAHGIYVSDEALLDPLGLDPGNLISGNTADDNAADGIAVAKGGHTLAGNSTRGNHGWGINAAMLNFDGGRNAASGNGQAAQCAGVFCKEDWDPPETSIDDHPPAFTRSSSATFAFSGEDDFSTGAELEFECRLYRVVPRVFEACTSPQTFTGLSTGSYTFEVRATDAAGNVDESPASFTWSIDVTPPETSIDSGPPSLTRSTSASFQLSADEAGSTFECSLDGAPFGPCADYQDLAEGDHTLHARATDPAGNVDASPASYSWTIDTTPPETSIDSGPASPTRSTSASFTFSADEAGSRFECSLDDAEFEACGAYEALGDGEHTLRARATDAAGNADPSPAVFTWIVDTTLPQTTIDSGPANPTNSTSALFEFSSDEPGSTFQCSLDGAEFGACSDYADLAEGDHRFRVRATDVAGNTGPAATHSWTIDTTPPQTTINAGPTDPTNNTSAHFEFSSSEAGSTFQCSLDGAEFGACSDYTDLAEGDHRFRVRATDVAGNTGPAATHSWTIDLTPPDTTIGANFELSASEPGSTFECSLDGAPFGACGDYSDVAEGEHTLRAHAIDRAGNVDPTPASFTWTVDKTPPETTIDSGPASPTDSTSATFELSSSEDGSTFECSLDGGTFGDCAAEYGDLAEGLHIFRVRATDAAGNTDPTPALYEWEISVEEPVDTTPPDTAIGDRPSDRTNSTSATFTFSADEAGSRFECSLDGAAFAACASPRQYSGLAQGAHTFRVRATDAAGNTDAAPASHSWTIDTTAPQTTLTAGPPALTSSTSATFAFSSEAEATFECSLDNAAFTACASPHEHSGFAAGSHTFRVRARDAAGNVDPTPAAQNWTIDDVAPQTTINSAPSPQTTSTSASFTFSSSEQGATFECSLDGGTFTACTSPRQLTGLAQGMHSFRIRARDAAGNTDATPATHTWTIDNAAPQTTITSAPHTPTNSTTASFAFSSSEAGSTFECSLDNAAFAACTSPRQHSGLAQGTHTFRVRARDAAGNLDSTPAIHTWTIDTSAPQTTINSAPSSPTTSKSATFTFSANQTGSTFECALDNGAFAACSSPHQLSGLGGGSHTFRVRARDAAGNVDATPATHGWTIESTAPCAALTVPADADAWVDENSASSNKGTDSTLKVQSKGPRDNFRALVRFASPQGAPAGCVLSSATLRLYAGSSRTGRTLHALRLASTWTENAVNWNNQPQTTGPAAAVTSGSGYREWNVTPQVEATFQDGANHGFLIRDSVEGADAEQQFHSREKGENPPQLVLRFAALGG